MPRKNQKIKVFKKQKGLKSFLWRAGLLFVFCVIFGPAIVFLYLIKDLPRPENFTEGLIIQSTKIYDKTGEVLLYEIAGDEKRTVIASDQMPELLKKALIATEDKHFFQHQGVDFKAIIRAVLYDLKLQQPVQGASTISQQLIRTYFLTQHKTLKRKTREIILTLEIERRYSKEQILDWYLNLVPFGSNLYGVEAAANSFFNKKTADLSLAQSAVLVAVIKSPTRLSPYKENRADLLDRKDFVLDNMVKTDFISQEEAEKAKQEKIEFYVKENQFKAPHFVMFVRDYLENKYKLDYLQRAGLQVITTLDFDLQEKAEKIIREGVAQAQSSRAYNGALVALNPKTGELLAMVGSRDYFGESLPKGCLSGKNCLFDPQVNVALSQRQPGSSFKPFVYALAFYKGFTPKTHIWDVLTEFNQYCSNNGSQKKDKYGLECYHPQNYDGTFRGQTDLKSALAQSRNVPSVKVLYLAGLKQTLDFVKKFGLTTLGDEKNYGLALVLGGGEVKLLEMVQGYSVFANDGNKVGLNFIKEIKTPAGTSLEKIKINPLKTIPSQVARQINDILSDNEARAPVFGWNSPLYLPGFEVAAKTGTTQEFKDAWTIGYTPNFAAGVWVGNNDNTPATREGSYLAGPIWKRFMMEVLPNLNQESFIKPEITDTENSVLDGAFLGNHSILFYLNKNNPQEQKTSRDDPQFQNWEAGVANWLNSH